MEKQCNACVKCVDVLIECSTVWEIDTPATQNSTVDHRSTGGDDKNTIVNVC